MNRNFDVIAGTVAATCFAATLRLLTLEQSQLTPPICAALGCYALTIPLLIGFYFRPPLEVRTNSTFEEIYLSSYLIVVLAAAFGITCLFFVPHWIFGALFVVGCLVSLWMTWRTTVRAKLSEEKNKN